MEKTESPFLSPRSWLLLTAVIVVAGLFLWVQDRESDPPMYYEGLGQSLSTDPAQYSWHARNKVLFDDWDPFEYPRWTVYQHSLTSLVAWLWFSAAGVSSAGGAMAGILLTVGTLVVLLVALRPFHRPWVLAAVALCFMMNVTLVTYGRLSYLENGLIFISAVLFLCYTRLGDRLWGLAVCGVVAACAALCGKLFGAMLLPVLALTVYFGGGKVRWKHIVVMSGTALVSGFLLMLILYGGDVTAAFGYAGEQSLGLRGFPEGLSSPWGFAEHLVSYGFKNRLLYTTPDLFMFILVAGSLLAWLLSSGVRLSQLAPTIQFATWWFVAVFLALMPLNYSPIRYAIFLIPAVILLPFALYDTALKMELKRPVMLTKTAWGIIFFLCWYASFHLGGNFFYFNVKEFPMTLMTWSSFGSACILFGILWLLFGKKGVSISGVFLKVILVVVLLLSVTANSARIRRTQLLEENYTIKEANADLPILLGEGAVLSGPYAAVFTANNNVKSFIHLFGVAEVDSTLFDRYPVTHLAVDASNWTEAIKQYPQLTNIAPMTSYWIRDYEVKVYPVWEVFDNATAHAYQPTDYEQIIRFINEQKEDSAFALSEQLFQRYPEGKTIAMLYANLLIRKGRLEETYNLLKRLCDVYPTDWSIQYDCARFIQTAGLTMKNKAIVDESYLYYKRAVDINRFKGVDAMNMMQSINRQFKTQGNP
jgi:tetratricopeptide (TPR) repeat protein